PTYTLSGNKTLGYTISGLADGTVITVHGASGASFDTLVVENSGSDRFDIADIGARSADTYTPETFVVTEDESGGAHGSARSEPRQRPHTHAAEPDRPDRRHRLCRVGRERARHAWRLYRAVRRQGRRRP